MEEKEQRCQRERGGTIEKEKEKQRKEEEEGKALVGHWFERKKIS